MAKAATKARAAVSVPQTREAVTEAIAQIGRALRARDRLQAAMNDEIAVVRQRYETQAQMHADAIAALTAGVQTWCEANRAAITNGSKTANLGSGEVRWRMTPPQACDGRRACS